MMADDHVNLTRQQEGWIGLALQSALTTPPVAHQSYVCTCQNQPCRAEILSEPQCLAHQLHSSSGLQGTEMQGSQMQHANMHKD